MFDVASRSEHAAHQRAVGALRVSFKRRGAATVLDGLHQAGCLKARFPRVEAADWATSVTLNTSGGIAGGDRLALSFDLAAGTRATIAAQAAERFYRALPGGAPSSVRTRIGVADGAAVEWLPQETILFDRCALDRRLEVDLAPDAWFLGVESLVFGRAAMGETVAEAWLRDVIRVRRGEELLLHDAIRLDGTVDEAMRRAAAGNGARAVATVVHVAPSAPAALDAVRAAFSDVDGVECGASAWNGMLIARILAPTSARLRAGVTAALCVLRDGRALPRVWTC
ncbi:MAG: urease accessory protein UreD [Acetobacteraceae bacterium]